jgi:hypothetical protein
LKAIFALLTPDPIGSTTLDTGQPNLKRTSENNMIKTGYSPENYALYFCSLKTRNIFLHVFVTSTVAALKDLEVVANPMTCCSQALLSAYPDHEKEIVLPDYAISRLLRYTFEVLA